MTRLVAFVLGVLAGAAALALWASWPYVGPVRIRLEPVPPYPAREPWGDL